MYAKWIAAIETEMKETGEWNGSSHKKLYYDSIISIISQRGYLSVTCIRFILIGEGHLP